LSNFDAMKKIYDKIVTNKLKQCEETSSSLGQGDMLQEGSTSTPGASKAQVNKGTPSSTHPAAPALQDKGAQSLGSALNMTSQSVGSSTDSTPQDESAPVDCSTDTIHQRDDAVAQGNTDEQSTGSSSSSIHSDKHSTTRSRTGVKQTVATA
jgi:hypothetical protein